MNRKIKLFVSTLLITTFTVGATNCFAFNLTDKYKEMTNKLTNAKKSVSIPTPITPVTLNKTPKVDFGNLRKHTGIDGIYVEVGDNVIKPQNPISDDTNSLTNYKGDLTEIDTLNVSDTLFNYIYFNLLNNNSKEIDKLLQTVKVFNPIAYHIIDYSTAVIKEYIKESENNENLHFYGEDVTDTAKDKVSSSLENSLSNSIKTLNKSNLSMDFTHYLLTSILGNKAVKDSMQNYILNSMKNTVKKTKIDARTLPKEEMYSLLKTYPINNIDKYNGKSIFSPKYISLPTLTEVKKSNYKEVISVLLDYSKYSLLSDYTKSSQQDLKACIENTMQYLFFTQYDNLVKIVDTRNDTTNLKDYNRTLTMYLNNNKENKITLLLPSINKSGDTIYCSNSYLITKYFSNISNLPLFNITYAIDYIDIENKTLKDTTSRVIYYKNKSSNFQTVNNTGSIRYKFVSSIYKGLYNKDINPKVYFGDNDTVDNQDKFLFLSKDTKKKALKYKLNKKVVPFTAELTYTGISTLLNTVIISFILLSLYILIRKSYKGGR